METEQLRAEAKDAVARFWGTRQLQAKKQAGSGKSDKGARAAVTGGAQMDGFMSLFAKIIEQGGVPSSAIFRKKAVELPGFFRPTKEWDLLVVLDGQLLLALEAKSQIGPSFGNNFNNRTEEAMGSALDLWTAFREGAFNRSIRPWLGYLMLLEDCEGSRTPVKVTESHFKVFKEFRDASYTKRYELFCRKLMREGHYSSTCFLASEATSGLRGNYAEPSSDLSLPSFMASLSAHVQTHAGRKL